MYRSFNDNLPELDWTGPTALPPPRSRHPAPTPPPTGWAPVKNINNHLITFGTKLNLRAHRNIKHYIINTKIFSSIFVAPGGVPTPSWRVSTIYIYICTVLHSTLYRIQIFKIYSIFKPNPNISNISYFNTGSKYLQYTTGFGNNPCIVSMVQHRVQYRQHIENSTIKIPVHIWYSTYIYCIHTSGLFSTQYIFTGTVHTGCPRASQKKIGKVHHRYSTHGINTAQRHHYKKTVQYTTGTVHTRCTRQISKKNFKILFHLVTDTVLIQCVASGHVSSTEKFLNNIKF